MGNIKSSNADIITHMSTFASSDEADISSKLLNEGADVNTELGKPEIIAILEKWSSNNDIKEDINKMYQILMALNTTNDEGKISFNEVFKAASNNLEIMKSVFSIGGMDITQARKTWSIADTASSAKLDKVGARKFIEEWKSLKNVDADLDKVFNVFMILADKGDGTILFDDLFDGGLKEVNAVEDSKDEKDGSTNEDVKEAVEEKKEETAAVEEKKEGTAAVEETAVMEEKKETAAAEEKKEEPEDKKDTKMEESAAPVTNKNGVTPAKRGRKRKGTEEPKPKELGSSRYGRQRKSVKQFEFAVRNEDIELNVPDGAGVPLGDIPNVNQMIGMTKAAEPFLRKLHLIVYHGQRSTKNSRKKNLRKFKGFDKKEDKEDLSEEVHVKFMKCEVKLLKMIADLLDVDKSGTKDEIGSRLVEFLWNPQPSGNPFKKPGKRKKKTPKRSTKKKKKAKNTGPKRPANAYMLFGNEHRDAIKEKNPELKMTQISKVLGEMWKKLDDEGKKPYVDKSNALKAEFRANNPTPKKTPKKKTPKKKTPKASKKKKKEVEVTESENEETSDEEPLAKKKKTDITQQIKDEITVILKEGDLDTLSVKKIRAQLKVKFGDDPVREHKGMIKEFINSVLEKL